MAASAISSGVIGRAGDIEGVWIAPVTAQVMMTLRLMRCFLVLEGGLGSGGVGCGPLVGREGSQPFVAPSRAFGDALGRRCVRPSRRNAVDVGALIHAGPGGVAGQTPV